MSTAAPQGSSRRSSPWYVLPAVGGLVVLSLPYTVGSAYWVRQVLLIAVLSMVVSSLNLSFGFAGELALGQVAVYAAGAYVAGYLGTQGHTDALVQLAAGGAASVVVGLLVGIPGLRFGGWALAMSSFFLVLLIPDVIPLLGTDLGGFAGLSGIPSWTLFGAQLSNNGVYLLVVGVAVAWYVVFRNLVTSRYGNGLLVMRQSPVLASSLGIPVYGTKLSTYALGSVPAGLAGVMYTQIDGFISPTTFDFSLAIAVLAASVLGGKRSVYGALFGATLLQLVPLRFTSVSDYQTVIYGVFLVACGVLLSQGVSGLLAPFVRRLAPGSRPCVVPVAPRRSDNAPPTNPAPIVDAAPRGKRLAVDGAALSFGGNTALRGVTLAAQPGQITALIGPNGSGKTTLLNVVSGFYRLDSGSARLGDSDIQGRNAHRIARMGIARTFQTPLMPSHLTTAEVIASGRFQEAAPRAWSSIVRAPSYRQVRRRDGERTAELLELLGLDAVRDVEAASLPLGTRRLAEVGRALAGDPSVVLLDEVASGLDETELDHLADVLTAIRATGVTVVLVEHNFALVLRLADVIYVLSEGEVLATGTPEEIRNNLEVERVYLGGAPTGGDRRSSGELEPRS